MTQSKIDKYIESLKENKDTSSLFNDTYFPLSIRSVSSTLSQNLISVKPLDGSISEEDKNKITSRLIQENRDGKIESVLENKDFTEKKIEDDEEFKKLNKGYPSPELFYLDFVYGSTSSSS